MEFLLVILVVTSLIYNVESKQDSNSTIMQVVAKHGYPVENHTVLTEDGYLLSFFRIPHGRNGKRNNIPIMIMHGLSGCSENFITLGPDNSLAYNLADAGYDVWLANSRGNSHGRRHVTYNPDFDREFWDFSFHEVGVYDLPAGIDYILNITTEPSLVLLGHSQGGTDYFILLSERPEYSSKVRLSVQFAPSVVVGFITIPLGKILGNILPFLELVINILDLHEFYPDQKSINIALQEFCSLSKGFRKACTEALYYIGGAVTGMFDENTTDFIVNSSPAGVSVKSILHYMQGIKAGSLKKYDYGKRKNLELYNRPSPPLYNLLNDVPIVIMYGKSDWLVPMPGMKALMKLLPNVVLDYKVPFELFGHVDFIFNRNLKKLVHQPLINFMAEFFNQTISS